MIAGDIGPVQGEADFLIAHPEDGILVLEVKGGGGIAYDPETRRWRQAGHAGRRDLPENPFHQARGAMHSLDGILSLAPGWQRWRPVYGYGVGFPDGRYDVAAHPGAPTDLVIDRRHSDALLDRVRHIMGYWSRHSRPRRFGAGVMDALAPVLGFRFDIRTPLQLSFNVEDGKIVELTEQQGWVRAMILRLGRAAITGPAGSGKTVLATEIARRLALSGTRTLLTCLNRRLSEQLAAATARTPDLDVSHFHRLCFETAQEAGLPVRRGLDLADGSPNFDHDLPDLLERAARILGSRYDAMVVDEAHDFKQWWWPALLSLHADPNDGRLFPFADANQNLYPGRRLPSRNSTACRRRRRTSGTPRGDPRVHLDLLPRRRGSGLSRAGWTSRRRVAVSRHRRPRSVLSVVLKNLVEQEHVPLEDIVPLAPARAAKSELRRLGSVDGFRFSDEPEPGALLAATVHGFTGLERPEVILAGLGERHEGELEQYLYAGRSRARNHLIVLAPEPVAARLRELTSADQP